MRRVAVVGLGLMGGSFVQALKAARPDLELVGVDTDPSACDTALGRGWVDSAGSQPGIAGGSEVVVVAVPLANVVGVLAQVAPAAPGAVVTDMTSVKKPVMAAAARLGLDLVGGHPMCGREESGIGAADGALFRGAAWVLSRRDDSVEELVAAVGARRVILDPEQHDHLVAGVSHAAFALSIAYVLALSDSQEWSQLGELAGSGFRDMSRLAAGDPKLYSDIALANSEHLAGWLDAVAESLAQLRARLFAGETGTLELFQRAAEVRRSWARQP